MASGPASIAIPGQLLGPAHKYLPGRGTHIHEDQLFSSLLGVVAVSQPAKAPGPAKRLTKITPLPQPAAGDALPTISVMRTSSLAAAAAGAGAGAGKKREVLPEVGNTVLCRVIRITPRQAVVVILVCGDTVLEADWQGLIRAQDVRATEKDRVKIYESFRPGDIVRADVISLGDQANYYLSTARNELGVIMATSEAGNTMVPVSWKEYKDPETGMLESRKVAMP